MKMRGSYLLSGNHFYSTNPPPAFLEGKTEVEINRFMENYVKSTVAHYRGKISVWDVVDEAIPDTPNEDPTKKVRWDSPYAKIDDYVCKAFQAAREKDSQAKLFYSDYGFESKADYQLDKSDRVFNFVSDLK